MQGQPAWRWSACHWTGQQAQARNSIVEAIRQAQIIEAAEIAVGREAAVLLESLIVAAGTIVAAERKRGLRRIFVEKIVGADSQRQLTRKAPAHIEVGDPCRRNFFIDIAVGLGAVHHMAVADQMQVGDQRALQPGAAENDLVARSAYGEIALLRRIEQLEARAGLGQIGQLRRVGLDARDAGLVPVALGDPA